MADRPDVWLRGPVEGIPPMLQPAAHSLLQVLEEIEQSCKGLPNDRVWVNPGGAASIGYHLNHLAGSLDRLLTYARGEQLTVDQISALKSEARPVEASLEALMERLRETTQKALLQLRNTSQSTLAEPREVGRSKLPSTVIGLLFHAAEHAYRHSGQIASTAKMLSTSG